MENDTPKVQGDSDIEQIKKDLTTLYDHMGAVLGKKTEEARVKWKETQASLEEKRKALEEKAEQLMKSGSAASSDLKVGFDSAFDELRKAFTEAKSKFDND